MNYWLALHSTPGIGPSAFNKLLDKFGTLERVFFASREELMQIPRLPEYVIKSILSKTFPDTDKIMSELKNRQFELITRDDKRYPEKLKTSTTPPPIIYIYPSNIQLQENTNSIAIIGARMASQEGLNTAFEFAKFFARNKFYIVSGYAKGIDTYAHLGAITGGSKTIMVLPIGVFNFVVHEEFRHIREKLFSQSIIVSEFFPSAGWSTAQAMLRNRRISELSRAVVVIEPGIKGGTIATTRWARKLNKPIFMYKKLFSTREKEFLDLGAIPIQKPEEIITILGKK